MRNWKCMLGFHDFWAKDMFTTREKRVVPVVLSSYSEGYYCTVKDVREHDVHWRKCARCGAAFEINAERVRPPRPPFKRG